MSTVKLPATLRAYIVLVALLGLALTSWCFLQEPLVIGWHRSTITLLIWLALVTVVDVSPMTLPRGGATASVSSVLDFAAILAFGPALAVQLAIIAVLVSRGIIRREPWYKLLFNGCQIAISIGVAGFVYTGLGGAVGNQLSAGAAIIPLVAAATTYFLMNTTLVSLAVGLSEKLAWSRIWESNFQWEMIYLLAYVPLGLLVALVQEKIGIWGVLLLFIQLLVLRYTFKLSMDLREANRGIVSVLATVIDAKDPYTHGHSYRVSQYGVRVARAMNLPERTVELIQCSALLHDVGKIVVAQEILQKPDHLTEDERQLMRSHAQKGSEMIQNVRFLSEVRKIVRTHHERPDGQGYPHGLSGDAIPLEARIIAVLDAFDAMTSDRPYRPALPPEDAISRLVRGAGHQFDERVVMTVKRLFDSGELLLSEAERTATDANYGIY
jgi:putative nucleotidyltransferase with HDIG domain